MLIRNCWYLAGWSCEFEAGVPARRMLVGDPVVLWRKSGGAIVAMEDRCVHRLAPLSLGSVEGDSIRCLYHGLKFAADGTCTEIPGQDMIPASACVRTYPVVERGQWIWVWMGDPQRADPSRIPAVMPLDDQDWIFKTGMIDYRCNYELINDNLLDLCHLTFVHAKSFGAGESWANSRPRIEVIPEGVRSSRWIVDTPPIPPLGKAANLDRTDIWTTYDFVLPGVFLLYTALYPVGTAAKLCHEAPADDSEALFSNFTSQVVVALTETTSRYYYAWGPPRRHGTEADAEIMIQVANQAFAEDRVMIEAQQEVIDLDPSRRPLPTTADKAITIFTRFMRSQDQDPAARAAAKEEMAT